ncbi:hypothetical protein COCCADRAFT_41880 [Bipolaris zeicola 26-R-13]|uniref:Cytochrome P450 n=1 Tax=Cochliobolus carbonum (strain 26-R-13) TaxID=930089 RepID=W6XPD3_COCC2|nr:uncharacterized protein COCCADRAFT_41880 [Bipolaris zeicola 26-R-13]EUC27383.1 hypothetical protein COCCADRAFT_41880 [Bipolaris zeicola 26-R-13]
MGIDEILRTHILPGQHNTIKRYGKYPFRLITGGGEVTVFPPEYANLIRNERRLLFTKAFANDLSGHIYGLKPFLAFSNPKRVMQNVAKNQLTKYLNAVTAPLSKESTFAIDYIFGNDPEWIDTIIADSALQLVARLSSKVFLGDELCRNEAWLQATKNYTVHSVTTGFSLSFMPLPIQYIFAWFAKDARLAQKYFIEACDILAPIIMTCLTNEPYLIPVLRKEAMEVLSADGLSKAALANLKIMDSTLKEALQLCPTTCLQMKRIATETITLANDTILKKGGYYIVNGTSLTNPEIWPEPEKFDIYRFCRLRQDPATASKAHLVSTSPEHLGFRHGDQACPGRFFAANEVKIALCHLLLKYD